jgi:hypothetical protein
MDVPAEAGAAARMAPAVAGKALLFGLFVMVRRQLIGIRDRAEGRPVSASPWPGTAWRRPEPAAAGV